MILAEVSPRGFLRSLGDSDTLGGAGEGAPLYAFQPPPARHTGTAPPSPLAVAGTCRALIGWERLEGGGSIPGIGGSSHCDWWGSGVLSVVIGQRQLFSLGLVGD